MEGVDGSQARKPLAARLHVFSSHQANTFCTKVFGQARICHCFSIGPDSILIGPQHQGLKGSQENFARAAVDGQLLPFLNHNAANLELSSSFINFQMSWTTHLNFLVILGHFWCTSQSYPQLQYSPVFDVSLSNSGSCPSYTWPTHASRNYGSMACHASCHGQYTCSSRFSSMSKLGHGNHIPLPSAACSPWISSGLVLFRTRTTFSPSFAL